MRKSASFHFFKRKPIVQKDRYEYWRGMVDLLGFTPPGEIEGGMDGLLLYRGKRERYPHLPAL